MATIAEFRVAANDTALGTTFEAVPSLVCEMEQVITADDLGMWFSRAEKAAIHSALDADPTVVSYSEVTGDDDRWLFNIEFANDLAELFFIIVEEQGTMLTATASNAMWTIRLRFPARENVSRVYKRLTERNIHVDITRINELSKSIADEIGLTPDQYEALTAAIQHGYFEIPRETSMEELADELGISHQALSERFRRAYRTLVTSELDINDDVGRQFEEIN